MTKKARTAGLAVMLALTILVSTMGVGLVGAAPAEELSYEGDNAAPNPTFDVDSLTVARHPVDKGLSDAAMAGVYDDSGEWHAAPAFSVNTSMDESDGTNVNPYTYKPGHVDDPDLGVFPRTGTDSDGDQLASALNAASWTKSGANSSKLSVSNTEVAEGAEAVRFYTDGSMGSGDTATATYNNWTSELDSDESKRVLQIASDVDTLDSGAVVEVTLRDESGDTKTVTINSSADAAADSVLANATGDSYVEQVRLNKLSTVGGGDWSNIEAIDVTVKGGDADVSVSWLDAESKSKDELGQETVDSDGDGVYDETNTIYDVSTSGGISVNSMETLGSEFDNAVINDVSFPATFEAKMVTGDKGTTGVYNYNFTSASAYPAYDTVFDVSYRMNLPGYIDLSYSGVTFEMEQGWNSGRYVQLGYAEGVSEDTEFENVSYTSFSGSLGSVGDTITIDNTVQTDTDYVVTAEIKMVEDEKKGVLNTGSGAAPPQSSSGGGLWGFITSIPGMFVTFGSGLLGLKWLKG